LNQDFYAQAAADEELYAGVFKQCGVSEAQDDLDTKKERVVFFDPLVQAHAELHWLSCCRDVFPCVNSSTAATSKCRTTVTEATIEKLEGSSEEKVGKHAQCIAISLKVSSFSLTVN